MSNPTSKFNPDNYSYTVGIDFGTTYSGCSYVYTGDPTEEIHDVTDWPKQGGHVYPKVPSVLLYEPRNKTPIAWGYEAIRKASAPNSQNILVDKFKLLLDPEYSRVNQLPNGLTPLEVISDYLVKFHEYVQDELKRTLGAVYDHSRMKYCLTVPAMWNDHAKAIMREAAIIAGIVNRLDHPDRLLLTSEPEAAALYCEKKSDQFQLGGGQRFMICDAGGGTVDLIVFEIEDSNGSKSLREVTKGSGSSCGSTFLDRRMKDYINRRFTGSNKLKDQAMDYLMKHFINTVKPGWENEEDEFFTLPGGINFEGMDLEASGIIDGKLHIPLEDIRKEIFEPVILQVIELISGQIKQSEKGLSAIFLVGGFGQCKYLHKRVQGVFQKKVESIVVPSRGELAVVRGAVMFGMNPRVVTHRTSRRTYGLRSYKKFDPAIDPENKKVLLPDGRVFCRDGFCVYVNKGDIIESDTCISHAFHVFYPNDTESDLYAYDGDDTVPIYVTQPGVRKVALFPIKMPKFDNVEYGEKIKVNINMYFGQTEIHIETVIKDRVFMCTSAFDAHEIQKYLASSPVRTSEESSPPPPYE
ncbi:hypothetical protein CLU79DRAFT_779901 [Phycomyces nitens]|nr:hypothetical protein CLU79DRAFT_779901 [Phycomyces nitens]